MRRWLVFAMLTALPCPALACSLCYNIQQSLTLRQEAAQARLVLFEPDRRNRRKCFSSSARGFFAKASNGGSCAHSPSSGIGSSRWRKMKITRAFRSRRLGGRDDRSGDSGAGADGFFEEFDVTDRVMAHHPRLLESSIARIEPRSDPFRRTPTRQWCGLACPRFFRDRGRGRSFPRRSSTGRSIAFFRRGEPP